MGELTSAAAAPGPEDHAWGEGEREAILYLDLCCPACVLTWSRVRDLPLRLWLRHFPIAASRPRSPALHAAAEAAGMQGQTYFNKMWDSLLGRSDRTDDPHLWGRARALALDLERFEHDRRSTAVAERIRRDFESGIRAGAAGTPAVVIEGKLYAVAIDQRLVEYALA